MRLILSEEDLKRNNWKWAPIDELLDDDPLYKTIQDVNDNYLIDSNGRMVSKEAVGRWLNSYEAQTPYLAQNDNMSDLWLEKRFQHYLNEERNRQIDNFFLGNWILPSQIVGAFNLHKDNNSVPFHERLFLGTGNTGIFSHNFTERHPYIAAGGNFIFDIAAPASINKAMLPLRYVSSPNVYFMEGPLYAYDYIRASSDCKPTTFKSELPKNYRDFFTKEYKPNKFSDFSALPPEQTNNKYFNPTLKIDTDKRLSLGSVSSSRLLNHDIGAMTPLEVEKVFGPRAKHLKELYDIAKAHNFEGKFQEIGANAEAKIRSGFSVNRNDPDVAAGIEKARRVYDIPEYVQRFEKFGTLGDTFIQDARYRIDHAKILGVPINEEILGQHGVYGGAGVIPDPLEPQILIKDYDRSSTIQGFIQHEMNHAGHGMQYQPKYMLVHNEKFRPIPKRPSDTPGAKYMQEMDEIVERAKTLVEYADRTRLPGETLNDTMSRIIDDFNNGNIYEDLPGDVNSLCSYFEPNSLKRFCHNFVGGLAGAAALGYYNRR